LSSRLSYNVSVICVQYLSSVQFVFRDMQRVLTDYQSSADWFKTEAILGSPRERDGAPEGLQHLQSVRAMTPETMADQIASDAARQYE